MANFEWDAEKAKANLAKHGVSFDEAKSAVYDPLSLALYDPDHSSDEDRWILIGFSEQGRILAICLTLRRSRIRIITARKATRHEIKIYEESNTPRRG